MLDKIKQISPIYILMFVLALGFIFALMQNDSNYKSFFKYQQSMYKQVERLERTIQDSLQRKIKASELKIQLLSDSIALQEQKRQRSELVFELKLKDLAQRKIQTIDYSSASDSALLERLKQK